MGMSLGEEVGARLAACTMVWEKHSQNSENLFIASLLGGFLDVAAVELDIFAGRFRQKLQRFQ